MKTTTPKWIGRMIRPDCMPGGFSPGTMRNRPRPSDRRWSQHDDIIEAANRVLEKRMPSTIAQAFINETGTTPAISQ